MSISGITSSASLLQMQQAMFSKADVNQDGQLSQDEFTAIGQKMPGGGKNGGAHHFSGRSSVNFGFSAETLGSLLSAQQSSNDSTSRAAEIFAGADSDSDGVLTADELAADMAAHAPPGREGVDTSDMAARMIADGDADGDGQLSAEEFASLRPPGGPPPGGSGSSIGTASSQDSGDEAGQTYDAADTNKDGTVSMSELLASLQSASSLASGFSTEAADLMSRLLESLSQGSDASTVSASA
ncbi:MAG: EF-hand domain-containing protein [Caulobacter sp.]|nr:EF-hand domain-containing protein [Caulobacter sp.]